VNKKFWGLFIVSDPKSHDSPGRRPVNLKIKKKLFFILFKENEQTTT
jgi:hypothetical protein